MNKKRNLLISIRGDRSQSTMGKLYGISQQAWCKYENGQSTPNYLLMSKISKDAKLSIDDIFFADNDKKLCQHQT